MRSEEAAWIGARLAEHNPQTVLDLGSATHDFRTRQQPHIDKFIHAPLRARGVRVVCSDLKSGEGVDISGDIYDPGMQAELRAIAPDVVLCCNIFEHVTDRLQFASICDGLLPPGGRIVVTVPQSYPYHPDPIDSYYRPSPSDLKALFPAYAVIAEETIVSSTYWPELDGLGDLGRVLARCATLQGGLDATRARAHRLLWLFRPYKQAAAFLQKP
jgi:hypothetical protein